MGWTTHSVSREWKSLSILEKAEKSLKKIGTMLKDQVLQSFRIGFESQLCPKTVFPFEKCGYYLPQCILASSKWRHVSCLQLLLFFWKLCFPCFLIFSEKVVICTEHHFIYSQSTLLKQFPYGNRFHGSIENRPLFLKSLFKNVDSNNAFLKLMLIHL